MSIFSSGGTASSKEIEAFQGPFYSPEGRSARGMSLLVLSIAAVLAGGVFAMAVIPVEEMVITQGSIVSNRTNRGDVRHLEGGRIAAVHVGVGDQVAKGQLLVTIDNTSLSIDKALSTQDVAALEVRVVRLQAELDNVASPAWPRAEGNRELFDAVAREAATLLERRSKLARDREAAEAEFRRRQTEVNEAKARLAASARALQLADRDLASRRAAAAKDQIGKWEVDAAETKAEAERGNVAIHSSSVRRLEEAVLEARRRFEAALQSDRSAIADEIAKTQNTLAAAREKSSGADERLARTEVRAEYHGIVQNVGVVRGNPVNEATVLMTINPVDDELIVEARLAPQDMRGLKPGLRASIQISAYQYGMYGALPGELVFISPNTEIDQASRQPFYTVRIRIDRKSFAADDRKFEVVPGHQAKAYIVVGERTVMAYLFSRVSAFGMSVFRE